jgi:hypothetical protein
MLMLTTCCSVMKKAYQINSLESDTDDGTDAGDAQLSAM